MAVVVMIRVRNRGWKLLESQKTSDGQKSRTIENQKASMVLKLKVAELLGCGIVMHPLPLAVPQRHLQHDPDEGRKGDVLLRVLPGRL